MRARHHRQADAGAARGAFRHHAPLEQRTRVQGLPGGQPSESEQRDAKSWLAKRAAVHARSRDERIAVCAVAKLLLLSTVCGKPKPLSGWNAAASKADPKIYLEVSAGVGESTLSRSVEWKPKPHRRGTCKIIPPARSAPPRGPSRCRQGSGTRTCRESACTPSPHRTVKLPLAPPRTEALRTLRRCGHTHAPHTHTHTHAPHSLWRH